MKTVVTLGEMLVDFIPGPSGEGESGSCYYAKPGGAPANVAACVARLGGKSAFIGKRGMDRFGRMLKMTLEEARVNTIYFTETGQANTGLSFVTLDAEGDRSFTFYRHPCADMLLEREEIPDLFIEKAGILHVGSISLASEPSRSAVLHAVREAKRRGVFISYDPNWRPALWPDFRHGLDSIALLYPYCDVIKINREEMKLLAATDNPAIAAQYLHRLGIRHVLITLDREGCYYSLQTDAASWELADTKSGKGRISGKVAGIPVTCVDTTGAGDAFVGAFLYKLSLHQRKAGAADMVEWIRFAVAVSAWTTTRKGAISAMPTLEEAERFMDEAARTADSLESSLSLDTGLGHSSGLGRTTNV